MSATLAFDCQFRYPSGFELTAQFETHDGVTALCGPSGSGKTTVLSLIAGLLTPMNGQVVLRQRVVTDTKAGIFTPPNERQIGFLFHDDCLFPHLRVRANIAYGARRNSGNSLPVEDVAKTLEVADLLDRYPHEISGGQRQRVALARAIAPAPKWLLLDEPITAVEDTLRERIAEFIKRAVDQFAIPTLLVSHNATLVERLADRVLFINDGKVRETKQGHE